MLATTVLLATGCGGGVTPLDECYAPTLALDVCDPTGTFSLDSTNTFFPLVVGNATVLEGLDEGELVRVEITVLDETELVAGVTTRVVEAKEFIDGELEEVARDFYAVAADDTVCYFGEDVDNYQNGQVANNDGTWRAGVAGAMPGIAMPGTPTVGQRFFQESAPGVAIDMSRVDGMDLTVNLNNQDRTGVIRLMDSNPLEGTAGCEEEEEKLYVPDIGLASDQAAKLISFTPGA